MSLKNRISKKCTVCNKEYLIRADRAITSKFCSKECWGKRRKLNDCEYCHKPITSYHGKKYCSRKCSHQAMVGNKAPTWKDGKSLERDRARFGSELKEWRMQVFKRDKFTCQHCQNKKQLHAHHIIEWAKDESKRFDIKNGITLCEKCHSKVHGRNVGRKSHDTAKLLSTE
jgi:5-methylcytosine-specific restriction endonuclease McrA